MTQHLFMNTDTNLKERFYCLFLPSKSNYEAFFFLLMFSSWSNRELLFWSWIVFMLNRLVLERIVEHRLQRSQVLWELSAAWFSLHDKEGLCCLLQHGGLSLCAGRVCVCVCVCVCEGGGGGSAGLLKRGNWLTAGKKVEKWGEWGRKQGDEMVGVREGKTTSYRIPMIYF